MEKSFRKLTPKDSPNLGLFSEIFSPNRKFFQIKGQRPLWHAEGMKHWFLFQLPN